ncbi:MAG: hypothetical protein HFJ49_00220 [Clostridia bacterium]|jgi:hypothetical protein|nr:hypothetical protein [Clostridia bacterium]
MDDIQQLEDKLKKSKENIHLYTKDNKPEKIEDIVIDTNLPITERIYNFLKQVNNPYMLKVGNVVIEMEFSDNSSLSPLECIDTALINDCKSRMMSKV